MDKSEQANITEKPETKAKAIRIANRLSVYKYLQDINICLLSEEKGKSGSFSNSMKLWFMVRDQLQTLIFGSGRDFVNLY